MESIGETKDLSLEIVTDTFQMQTDNKLFLLEVRLCSDAVLEGELFDQNNRTKIKVKEIGICLKELGNIGSISDYVAEVSEATKQDRTEICKKVLSISELFPFDWLKTDGICVLLQGIASKYKFALGGGGVTPNFLGILEVTLTWQGEIRAKTWKMFQEQKDAVEINANRILLQQQTDQLTSRTSMLKETTANTRGPQCLGELGTKDKFEFLIAAEKSVGHIGTFKNWDFESVILQY